MRKRKKEEKVKKHNVISESFMCVDVSEEKLKSHLFTDMEFYVYQLENSLQTKH